MSKLGRYSADRKKIEDLIAAKTVTVADCGTIFTLNSATEFATTLPTVADAGKGWWCEFWVKAAPSGANYTVVTNGSENVIEGNVLATAAGRPADTATAGTSGDTITFVGSQAVVGDHVRLVCDGTNFWVTGFASGSAAITLTQAS